MSKLNLTTAPKLVQQQRLILTQELQLFLKLIQMNTLDLKEYLEEQLVDNPTLEESDEPEKDEKDKEQSDDEFDDIDLSSFENLTTGYNDDLPHSPDFFADNEDDNPWENRVSKAESLFEHLNWQLEVSEFTNDERDIANIIIGNINEDGYLEANIDEIILNHFTNQSFNNNGNGSLKNSEHINKENILKVLNKIQTTFDPIAVGSRSLEECLKIQTYEMGYTDDSAIIKIIENHLEEISRNEYEEVSKSLLLNTDEVKECFEIISNLEPKPGRPFYTKDTEKFIVPDFFLYKVGNEYQIQFNKNFPRIRISNYYRNLIKNQANLSSETKKYVREKLEAAKRILKCLEEREAAVRKVVERITEVQRDYFEHGEEYLKPLRLKDVAETVGVHESTVSRITSNRYMQTPRGVIELKSLFSRGVDTSTGKQVSLERVKSIIKEIVSNENTGNPFSDEDISKILERRNIMVARRTVAKYRMILKIPSSSKRMQRG